MESEEFKQAKRLMLNASYVSVVLTIIGKFLRDVTFPESVELIELAKAQLNKILKVE